MFAAVDRRKSLVYALHKVVLAVAESPSAASSRIEVSLGGFRKLAAEFRDKGVYSLGCIRRSGGVLLGRQETF